MGNLDSSRHPDRVPAPCSTLAYDLESADAHEEEAGRAKRFLLANPRDRVVDRPPSIHAQTVHP